MSNEQTLKTTEIQAGITPYDMELRTHTAELSPEDAARIEQNFELEVHVGVHGKMPGEVGGDKYGFSAPTQTEYEAAAAVIESLQVGDVLFLEGYGFEAPVVEPFIIPEAPSPADEPGPPEDKIVDPIKSFLRSAAAVGPTMIRDNELQKLDDSRRGHNLSSFSYARDMATLKGIPVVYADSNMYAEAALIAETGKTLGELFVSEDEAEKAAAARAMAERELAACYTLKDWALDHLPAEGTLDQEARKPRLVLLFGLGHKDGLQKAFGDIGLHPSVSELETSDKYQRASELFGHMFSQLPELEQVQEPSAEPAPSVTLTGGMASREGGRAAMDRLRSRRVARDGRVAGSTLLQGRRFQGRTEQSEQKDSEPET